MAETKEKLVALTPRTFRNKMKKIAEDYAYDPEAKHCKMDDLICQQLKTLGYGGGIKIFENTKLW